MIFFQACIYSGWQTIANTAGRWHKKGWQILEGSSDKLQRWANHTKQSEMFEEQKTKQA